MKRRRDDSWLIKWSDALAVSGPAATVLNVLVHFKVPIAFALGGGLATFALILHIVAMMRLWKRSPKIWFVASDNGKGADRLVERARDKICMTHASGIVPHSVYQNLLLEKIDKRVIVERYIQRDETHAPQQFEWLKNFTGRKYYKQFEVPSTCPLPLDIMTFDDDTVVLHLPRKDSGDDFFSAIIIEDEDIKKLFDNVFRRLRNRCEGGSFTSAGPA